MARTPTLFSPLFGAADPFLSLHRDINRLFDDVLRTGPQARAAGGDVMLAPSIDVTETDGEVRIKADLPGIDEQDIDVSLRDDMLTIRAEKRQDRKEEREGVHLSERSFGTFQRTLRLPFHTDPQKVQASYQNGVLSLTLPKTPQEQRQHRIEIRGAQPRDDAPVPNAAQQLAGGPGNGSQPRPS